MNQNKQFRYLDNELYKKKYVEAYQFQHAGDYQTALSKFLEIREMGFTNFDLLYSISLCCINTNSIDKCQEIINFMKSRKYQEDISQEIQLIEKEFKKVDIRKNYSNKFHNSQQYLQNFLNLFFIINIIKVLLSQFNSYNYFKTVKYQCLSLDQVEQFWNSIVSLGNYELCSIIINKFQKNCNEHKNFVSNYLNHKYSEALSILQQSVNFVDDKYGVMGDCCYQMKDYKNSLLNYEKQFILDKHQFTFQKIMRIHSIQLNFTFYENFKFTGFNLNQEINEVYWDIQSVQNLYQWQKEWNQNELNFFEQQLTNRINQGQLKDCYHQVNLLIKQNKHPQRQKQLIELILQYNKNLAEGYLSKYQYGHINNELIDYDDIVEKLMKCNNSVSKYTTLALILSEIYECQQALNYLQLAKKINIYDSQILIQERNINLQIQKYTEANDILKQVIILESQNSHFILTLIAPFIRKYQFHEALALLNLIQGNEIIEAHKLLLQFVNYNFFSKKKQKQLVDQIQKFSTLFKELFQGHLNLLMKNYQTTQQLYLSAYLIIEQLIKLITLYDKNTEIHIFLQTTQNQIKQSLILKEEQFIQMSHIEQTESILRLSAYGYSLINSNQNYGHIRFQQSLVQLFLNIVYCHDQQIVCQWINKTYEFKIPYMADLVKQFVTILNYLYGKDLSSYCEKAYIQLSQLNSQFESFQSSFQILTEFVETNEFQIQIIDKINIPLDSKLLKSQIFQNEYFYDPFSKIALNYLLKAIGYFIEFKCNWSQLLIGDYAEGYYRAAVLRKVKNQR